MIYDFVTIKVHEKPSHEPLINKKWRFEKKIAKWYKLNLLSYGDYLIAMDALEKWYEEENASCLK